MWPWFTWPSGCWWRGVLVPDAAGGTRRLEKLEFEELSRSRSPPRRCLKAQSPDTFPAQRAREQFERFFVPAFTTLLCLAEAAGAFFFWKWLPSPPYQVPLKEPMTAIFLFLLLLVWCCHPGPFFPPLTRGWKTTGCCAPARPMCCSTPCFPPPSRGHHWRSGRVPQERPVSGLRALRHFGTHCRRDAHRAGAGIYRPRVKGRSRRPLYESGWSGCWPSPRASSPPPPRPLTTSLASRFPRPVFTGFLSAPSSGWSRSDSPCCCSRPPLSSSSRRAGPVGALRQTGSPGGPC